MGTEITLSGETIPERDGSLSQKVLRGGLWVFILRGSRRVFELVRNLILARFLAPDDFGLMGIALITLEVMETFSQTGLYSALVQKKGNISKYLDAAWTLSLIRGIILFLILYFIGPFVSLFFEAPGSVWVIRVLGLSFIFQGLTNIRVIYFQKDMDFKKQFYFEASGFSADFVVSLSLLFPLGNVWTLVAGKVAGDIARTLASYYIDACKPIFDFKISKLRELFGFGRWIYFLYILGFAVTQGDSIFIGRIFGTLQLGFYRLGTSISNLPVTEIAHVISQVTFPAYSKLQDNLDRLREAFLKTLYLTATVSFIISSLTLTLITDFIVIFLGKKWLPMVMITEILLIAGLIRSIQAVTGPVFLAIGKPRLETICQMIRLSLLGMFIYPLSRVYGITGVPLTVLLSILATAICSYTMIKRILHLDTKRLLSILIKPMLAGVGAGGSILLIKSYVAVVTFLEFLIFGFLGILIYSVLIFLLEKQDSQFSIFQAAKEILRNRPI